MFEKDLALTLLFDTYGSLLPENQRIVFEQYYCDDLSLSEIAENEGITRQGVRDRIAKARTALLHCEETLGFVARLRALETKAKEVSGRLFDLEKTLPEEKGRDIEELRQILDGMPF